MDLQPLYEVKERLEQAAVAGVGPLHQDFRLIQALEELNALAEANPVFGRIAAGLEELLAAPVLERGGLLLDLLALVDAVAYTQGRNGIEGEISPLPAGAGAGSSLPYSQLEPLITAFTKNGSEQREVIQTTMEDHPEFFADPRILPLLIPYLGDRTEGELYAKILKKAGPSILPLLKKGFDPAGGRDMARRVEIISAVEGAGATPWLLDVLLKAGKFVRPAALAALGEDPDRASLLLKLLGTVHGKDRDGVLSGLAKLDGEEVRAFWTAELKKRPETMEFLKYSKTQWASELAVAAFRNMLEETLATGGETRSCSDGSSALAGGFAAILGNSSPTMLNCWRWVDSRFPVRSEIEGGGGRGGYTNLGKALNGWLLDSLYHAGPGPLAELCQEFWEKHEDRLRYLPHALAAALMTRPAAEVYDTFAPYILTGEPRAYEADEEGLQDGVLRVLSQVRWDRRSGTHQFRQGGFATAGPLDPRWVGRLLYAERKSILGTRCPDSEMNPFDQTLLDLVDASDPCQCAQIIPYVHRRMAGAKTWRVLGIYIRYLLKFGGSFKGLLKSGMQGCRGRTVRLSEVWKLLVEADKVLPKEETAALLWEVQEAEDSFSTDRERKILQAAFSQTLAELDAGRSFPAWEECMRLYRGVSSCL